MIFINTSRGIYLRVVLEAQSKVRDGIGYPTSGAIFAYQSLLLFRRQRYLTLCETELIKKRFPRYFEGWM